MKGRRAIHLTKARFHMLFSLSSLFQYVNSQFPLQVTWNRTSLSCKSSCHYNLSILRGFAWSNYSVCACVCVHTITCVSVLFLWVLNFLMSIQQSMAFTLVFLIRPSTVTLLMDLILLPLPTPSPRMLIDIMIFHLNLTQTILEPYSNTAKVFPFQTKRKKNPLHVSQSLHRLPPPLTPYVSDFISYCSLSTSLLCSSHTFFGNPRCLCLDILVQVVLFPEMLSPYPTCFLPLFLQYPSYLALHLHWKVLFLFCACIFIMYIILHNLLIIEYYYLPSLPEYKVRYLVLYLWNSAWHEVNTQHMLTEWFFFSHFRIFQILDLNANLRIKNMGRYSLFWLLNLKLNAFRWC